MLSLLLLACAARGPALPEVPTEPASHEASCAAFDDPQLTQRLDRRTDSLERQGNRAELLVNGEEAYRRRFANSADADLILVKTFIFTDDETGRRVAEVLMERARAGAFVMLQYDFKGSIGGSDDISEMAEMADEDMRLGELPVIRQMREAGVIVVPSNPPRRPSRAERWGKFVEEVAAEDGGRPTRVTIAPKFDHEKYWITGTKTPDGSLALRAILGGLNTASEYAYGGTALQDRETQRPGWRDTDVELRGPVANDVVDRYFDVAELHLGSRIEADIRERFNPPQPEQGDAAVRFIANHPRVNNKRSIEAAYRTLILATPPGEPVTFATAYFTPGRRIQRPMVRGLKHGQQTQVLTNSKESIDVWFVSSAARYEYRRLAHVNPEVELYEWIPQEEEGLFTYHGKVASFGLCGPAIVGSANLDAQSSEHNSESIAVIRDPEFRAAFDAMMAEDLAPNSATELDNEALKRTPLSQRMREALVYTTLWYWLSG